MHISAERLLPKLADCSAFYLEHINRYRFCRPYVQHKVVLDLGCGVGYGSRELIRLGAQTVFALDIDIPSITYAQRYYNHPRIWFQIGDAAKIPLPDNALDTVISFEVIEHINNTQTELKNFHTIFLKVLTRRLPR